MKLSDVTVNKWYRAARDINTSQGKIKKDVRVLVASKQGDHVYVWVGHKTAKIDPSDLKN